MYFCITSSIGTQGEFGRLKKCFKRPVFYSIDRSKAVVLVLFSLFVVFFLALLSVFFFYMCCAASIEVTVFNSCPL